MRSRFTTYAMALIVMSGCGDGLGPAGDLEVYVSAAPHLTNVGDTIELVGVAYNGSDVTIAAGAGCGPGIRFIVTDSVGTETDLMGGPWTCQLRDSNEIEPGETDVVDWRWLPPGPGLYRVHSYVHVPDGPTIDSRPEEVRIRE